MKTQIGFFIEFLKKDNGGYVIVSANAWGQAQRVHTYEDYSHLLSKTLVYEYQFKEVRRSSAPPYCVLIGPPKLVGDITVAHAFHRIQNRVRTWYQQTKTYDLVTGGTLDIMKATMASYLDNPKRYSNLDQAEVWRRVALVKADVDTLYKDGTGTAKQNTFNPKYATEEARDRWETGLEQRLVDDIESVARPYRNKAKHLTLSGLIEESDLTQKLDGTYGEMDINEFPATDIQCYVDSVFTQVALKERHIVEYFIYFAIISYMKRCHRFPVAGVADVCTYLNSFLAIQRQEYGAVKALKKLQQAGMIKIDCHQNGAELVTILSQSQYVSKWESRWNAKQYSMRKYHPNKELFVKTGQHLYELTGRGWARIKPTDRNNRPIKGLENDALNGSIRPYLDIWFPMSAKLDTGFIHLLNGHKADMKAWMYELCVSSWNYPICRTRIKMNLLLPQSSQRNYERRNRFMQKRYHHTELPLDFLNKMNPIGIGVMNDMIKKGGKFKRSKSGRIYRQEGNTYFSDRVTWKRTKYASGLRLSLRNLKLWRAVSPVFEKSQFSDGRVGYSEPCFLPIADELSERQSTTRSIISKKSDISKGKYFALKGDGVSVVSTDPRNWTTYEPFMEYDARNGDLVVTGHNMGILKQGHLYELNRGHLFETRKREQMVTECTDLRGNHKYSFRSKVSCGQLN